MNEPGSASSNHSLISFLASCAALISVAILVAFLCQPNYLRSGPSKTSGITWRLKLIDGAKQEWGLDHHQTNDVVMTADDLVPYLTSYLPQSLVKPVAGERYDINTLWKSPQAELTREIEGYPAGTLFTPDDIILPKPKGYRMGRTP